MTIETADTIEATPGGPHPPVETWIHYHDGRLSDTDTERLRGHLADCPSCVETVLDIEAFTRPEARDPEAPSSFERAVVWRALRSELVATAPAGRNTGSWTTQRVAASLAVPILALAAWAVVEHRTASDLRQELAVHTRPVLNPPVVDLYPDIATRSGGTPEVVEMPTAAPLTTFILNLAEPADYPDYAVEILDPSGAPLFSQPGLEMSEFGNFTLGLPLGFLPSGEYPVRVYGLQGDTRELLEEFQIKIP